MSWHEDFGRTGFIRSSSGEQDSQSEDYHVADDRDKAREAPAIEVGPKISVTGKIGTTLVYEDHACRVWLLELSPGESTDWHVHDLAYSYVVTQSGNVQAQYVDGTSLDQNDEDGEVHTCDDRIPHRLVNVGTAEYRNIVVEIKRRVR